MMRRKTRRTIRRMLRNRLVFVKTVDIKLFSRNNILPITPIFIMYLQFEISNNNYIVIIIDHSTYILYCFFQSFTCYKSPFITTVTFRLQIVIEIHIRPSFLNGFQLLYKKLSSTLCTCIQSLNFLLFNNLRRNRLRFLLLRKVITLLLHVKEVIVPERRVRNNIRHQATIHHLNNGMIFDEL